jgi:hypothetical protein
MNNKGTQKSFFFLSLHQQKPKQVQKKCKRECFLPKRRNFFLGKDQTVSRCTKKKTKLVSKQQKRYVLQKYF